MCFGRNGLTLVAGAEHYSALASVHMLRVVAVEARLREALDRVDDRRVEVHLDRPVTRRLFVAQVGSSQAMPKSTADERTVCAVHVIQPQAVNNNRTAKLRAASRGLQPSVVLCLQQSGAAVQFSLSRW
jgi:predicted anti-sigma-YlaC factor YlaD